MYPTKIKYVVRFFVLLLASLALMPISQVRASDGPELPPECGSIAVQAGNKLSFHTYASGVQIYRWNGSSWDFVAPRADLFAEKTSSARLAVTLRVRSGRVRAEASSKPAAWLAQVAHRIQPPLHGYCSRGSTRVDLEFSNPSPSFNG